MKKWSKYKFGKVKWWKYIRMKRITLESSPPIYRWLFWIWSPNKEEYQKILAKQGQRTFIYCPHCNEELISQKKAHLEHDLKKDPSEYYYCRNCYTLSQWNFDTPAILLEKTYEGTDEHKYKKLKELGYYANGQHFEFEIINDKENENE